MTVEQLHVFFNAIVDFVHNFHPQSQATSDTLYQSWDICELYAPHVLRLRVFRDELKIRPRSTEKLFDISFQCSWYDPRLSPRQNPSPDDEIISRLTAFQVPSRDGLNG